MDRETACVMWLECLFDVARYDSSAMQYCTWRVHSRTVMAAMSDKTHNASAAVAAVETVI